MSNVRIATARGALCCPGPLMVRLYSLMNPGVHTEIWFDDLRIASAYNSPYGCVRAEQMDEEPAVAHDGSEWHTVKVPVTDVAVALEFIVRALKARVPYGINVLECALPKVILDNVESDLDCCAPESWDRVFCSQFALLFLRWCDCKGILGVPKDRARALWTVNSRGCLPSRLQIITDLVFH